MYPIKTERNIRVRMRDGVELSTDVVRPDADGQFPVLIMRTPYGKDWSTGISGGPYEHEYYASRGYVVVQQDSRGRFDSAGVFEPFVDEAPDGWDTDEWAVLQPWSNGKLAGLGQSYYGFTQLAQALQRHPALATIAPIMTTSDTYNNWIFSDGAFHLGFAMAWGTGLLGAGTARPNPRIASPPVAGTSAPDVFAHLPVETMDAQQGQKQPVPFYREWLKHPVRDEHWLGRSLDAQVAAITAYIDHVVDAVGARLLGSASPIAEAVRRRRLDGRVEADLAERLLGVSLSRQLQKRGQRISHQRHNDKLRRHAG